MSGIDGEGYCVLLRGDVWESIAFVCAVGLVDAHADGIGLNVGAVAFHGAEEHDVFVGVADGVAHSDDGFHLARCGDDGKVERHGVVAVPSP